MAKPRRSRRTRMSRNSTSAFPKAGANRSAKASTIAGARGGWRKPCCIQESQRSGLSGIISRCDRNMLLFSILGLALLIALVFGPNWWVNRVIEKHGVDRPDLPGSGREFARHLLDEAKLSDVKVEVTDTGDHYDPGTRSVRL